MTTPGLRRFLGGAGRILFLALIFVIFMGGTAFLIALLLSGIRGTPVYEKSNLYFSLVCGLISWLFIAAFHLRKEVVRFPFQDRDAFLKRLQALAGELGYETGSHSENHVDFVPRFRAFLLGGGIQVSVSGHTGEISGPKVYLELLRRRLRFGNHLDNVHQSIQESRRRHGERLLKRVQLNLRFSPEKLPEIARQVLQPLTQEAKVVCELNILAQSQEGIRENTVENLVRPWLLAQGISAEIRKEQVQREENGKAATTAVGDRPSAIGDRRSAAGDRLAPGAC